MKSSPSIRAPFAFFNLIKSSSSTPNISIKRLVGMPSVFTVTGCRRSMPSGSTLGSAVIENGIGTPFRSSPSILSNPSAVVTFRSRSGEPL